MPNIKGEIPPYTFRNGFDPINEPNVFYSAQGPRKNYGGTWTEFESLGTIGINASRCSKTYKDGAKVTTKNLTTKNWIRKF